LSSPAPVTSLLTFENANLIAVVKSFIVQANRTNSWLLTKEVGSNHVILALPFQLVTFCFAFETWSMA